MAGRSKNGKGRKKGEAVPGLCDRLRNKLKSLTPFSEPPELIEDGSCPMRVPRFHEDWTSPVSEALSDKWVFIGIVAIGKEEVEVGPYRISCLREGTGGRKAVFRIMCSTTGEIIASEVTCSARKEKIVDVAMDERRIKITLSALGSDSAGVRIAVEDL